MKRSEPDLKAGIATSFLGNLRAGTWVYTWNLLRELAGRHDIVRVDCEERQLAGLETVPSIVVPGGGPLAKLVWPNIFMAKAPQLRGLDLVHATTPYGCFRTTRFKKIITICDVTPLLFPETHKRMNVWHHRYALPAILRQADHVITISESSKRDIVKQYGVAEDKITVTLLAADRRFYDPDCSEPSVMERPYILNVGTLEPRKNVPLLLRAFADARKRGLPHRLVVTGASGWGNSPVASIMDELQLHDQVCFTGFISDAELPGLYAGADFFVYPSLYEGFGLPVLESMACGTPVITSNVSSLPEVAGEAAILIDPRSREEICSSMLRLAGDSELRRTMRDKGKVQAGRFSWDRTADETWQVYGRVVHGA